jgi:hypothetical protein
MDLRRLHISGSQVFNSLFTVFYRAFFFVWYARERNTRHSFSKDVMTYYVFSVIYTRVYVCARVGGGGRRIYGSQNANARTKCETCLSDRPGFVPPLSVTTLLSVPTSLHRCTPYGDMSTPGPSTDQPTPRTPRYCQVRDESFFFGRESKKREREIRNLVS